MGRIGNIAPWIFYMSQMINLKGFMRRWNRSLTDIWTSTKESSQWIKTGRILFLRNTNKITRITNERCWRVMKSALSCFRPRLLTLWRRMSSHWNKQNRFWEPPHAEVIQLTIDIGKMCDRGLYHTAEHSTKHLVMADGCTNVGTANGTNDNGWEMMTTLPGCAGQAADAVSAYTQVKMEDAHKLLKIPKSECPDIWMRLPKHEWP